MKYILLLLLVFTSNIFAIELQEVPGYTIGKWKGTMNYSHPSTDEVSIVRSSYENSLSADTKSLEMKGNMIIDNKIISYSYTIRLEKNKIGLYEYIYSNDKGLNLRGTIQILDKLNLKMIDDKSKESTLIKIVKVDPNSYKFKVTYYHADGNLSYSGEGKSNQVK
jgi:hypothetical protein